MICQLIINGSSLYKYRRSDLTLHVERRSSDCRRWVSLEINEPMVTTPRAYIAMTARTRYVMLKSWATAREKLKATTKARDTMPKVSSGEDRWFGRSSSMTTTRSDTAKATVFSSTYVTARPTSLFSAVLSRYLPRKKFQPSLGSLPGIACRQRE
jgi:hypothetical protein